MGRMVCLRNKNMLDSRQKDSFGCCDKLIGPRIVSGNLEAHTEVFRTVHLQ